MDDTAHDMVANLNADTHIEYVRPHVLHSRMGPCRFLEGMMTT